MKNLTTYQKGDVLEEKVYEILKKMLEDERFYVPGKNSKIYRKKKYYSREREADITFDISIETFLPGATEYSLLTLIECKNYGRSVQVGDVQAFSDSVKQVGSDGTKGIMITVTPFQKSAQKVAINRKMALARVNSSNELEWISKRRDSSDFQATFAESEEYMESESGPPVPIMGNYDGFHFGNFQDILLYLGIIDQFFPSLKDFKIPYRSEKDIQERINELALVDCYDHFTLNMDRLCGRMSELYDANFVFTDDLATVKNSPTIGQIRYDPLTIYIRPDIRGDIARWRFTLAHEIGHLVLHSAEVRKYFAETADTEEMRLEGYAYSNEMIKRMEIQANLFAALLLMPTQYFQKAVRGYFTRESIQKGFLYLDHQPQNMKLVMTLLAELELIFGVSKEAAKYRLKGLGLLKDAADNSVGTHLRNLGY